MSKLQTLQQQIILEKKQLNNAVLAGKQTNLDLDLNTLSQGSLAQPPPQQYLDQPQQNMTSQNNMTNHMMRQSKR